MTRPQNAQIGLWIDQKLDTGHGLPEETCREVIQVRGVDPYHYAVQDGMVIGVGLNGIVLVPELLEDAVIEAAEEQLEENIYLQYVKVLGGEIVGFYQDDVTVSEWKRNPTMLPAGVNQ